LVRLAEGRLHVLEPSDLGVDGAGVPDALVDAVLLEEGVLQRRRAGDGEVGALAEVRSVRLRRRRQRQPEVLRCKPRIASPIRLRTKKTRKFGIKSLCFFFLFCSETKADNVQNAVQAIDWEADMLSI
jgi:hypothetical protein